MAYPELVDGQVLGRANGLSRESFQRLAWSLERSIGDVAVVSPDRLRFLLLALVCQGHVLLEDCQRVGKTLVAKTMAQSIDAKFARVQCTPDLLPSDITGTSIFNMRDNQFEFRAGPIFSNILLADEINRTGPRTQSALLEAMAEFQVSADGDVRPLPTPFMVIATQNSTESHGVYPLPDSQYDRFLMRMSLGMPSLTQELEILSRARHGLPRPQPVVTTVEVAEMQTCVLNVDVSQPVSEYVVRLARATRDHPLLSNGVSPRGTVLLQRASQGWAALEGRAYVVPEDVKRVAPLVLPHRITVRGGGQVEATDVISEVLDTVDVPV